MNFNKMAFIKNYLYNSQNKTPFKKDIHYLVAIFFIFFIFLIEYFVWTSNSFSFLFLHDAYTQTFPWMARVLEGWRNFDIPFWTWGSGLGISLIGELQPGVLYPITILASFFHGNEINTINRYASY